MIARSLRIPPDKKRRRPVTRGAAMAMIVEIMNFNNWNDDESARYFKTLGLPDKPLAQYSNDGLAVIIADLEHRKIVAFGESMTIDGEMGELRAQLDKLRSQKRRLLKPKPKSTRPRGRPRIAEKRIRIAFELAKDHSIADVSLVTGICERTLYDYGIRRYRLNAAAADANANGFKPGRPI